jgi:nitroimidazol reductase NimA-like FMN-containing flavoprotein (pyridoxamine 5'-phosphate oxidase superfamily)
MRRGDREVTDIGEIFKILDKCDVCRLGLYDGERVYIVPLSFAHERRGDALTLYFHGATSGRKLDIIAQNPHAGFEADCNHSLIADETACEYGMEYESVIGTGTVTLCDDNDEKRDALLRLMSRYAPKRDFALDDRALGGVAVFKLTADEFTAKRCVKGGDRA